MKRNTAEIRKMIYTFFVMTLMVCIIIGLMWVDTACGVYKNHSASAVLKEAKSSLEGETGLEFELNPVPYAGKNGEYIYRLNIDKEPRAEIALTQSGSGLLNLALFDLQGIKNLVSYDIVFPGDVQLYAGGVLLSKNAYGFSFMGTDTLAGTSTAVPEFRRLEVDTVYDLSQISAERGGERLKFMEIKDGLYYVAKDADEAVSSAVKSRAEQFSRAYSNYISKDAGFYYVQQYLTDDSPLVSRLLSLDVNWYTAHYAVEFENFKASEPLMLSDGIALVNASYDYISYWWGGVVDNYTELQLIMQKVGGSWYVAELANAHFYME